MKTDLIWPTAFVGRAGGLMSVLMASLLAGCSHLGPTATDPSADDPAPKLTHLYDYQLIDSQRQTPLTLPGLVEQLAHADVIFVGEYHGNHASHLLQAQLQAALYAQHPHQVLSLEQFERDDQNTLERYLEGQIGEKTLIKATDAWPNYAGSYRPMVHFAKRHLLPVIAANAPGAIVRCVGRHGPDYLKRLPDTQTAWVAQTPFYNPKAYQAKFAQLMQRGSHKAASASASETAPDLNARQRRSYQAQLLRDNTMAESILKAKRQYPKHKCSTSMAPFTATKNSALLRPWPIAPQS